MTTTAAMRDRRLAWQSPAVGVALGLALLASSTSTWGVQVAVGVTQLLVVVGAHRAVQAKAPLSGMLVAAVAAAVADVAVARADAPRTLEPLITVVALSVLAAFGQQLGRRDGRGELLISLAATVVSSGLAVATAAWTVLVLNASSDAVRLAAAVLVVCCAVRLVPSDTWASWCVLVAGPLTVGLVAGFGHVDRLRGLPIGLAVGVAVAVTDAVVRRGTGPLRARWWTTGAAAVGVAGPLVYLAGQALR